MPRKKKVLIPNKVLKLVKKKSGIDLDVGCGSNKQPHFLGMDRRKTPVVDIVHDAEIFPWPLPDNSCNKVLMSHLVEHIKPWLMIDLMDEIWRVLKLGGQLLIAVPYATSFGFYQDPTHCNPCNEATFTYFDPRKYLFRIYEPKPWSLVRNAYQINGNMEIILEKMSESQMRAIPEWKNMKKSQEAAWKKNIEEGVHSEDNKK